MNEIINEKISVILTYDRMTGIVMPKKIRWIGRDYVIKKLTYHHKIRQGRQMFHIFHITDGVTDFRIRLDTETLHWTLEEVEDGIAD